MKDRVITEIQMRMSRVLSQVQLTELTQVLSAVFQSVEVVKRTDNTIQESIDNVGLLKMFLSAKRVEGCSDKSLKYYESTIQMLLTKSDIPIREIDTDNLRGYLSDYQKERKSSKVTIDNMRRIFSS